MPPDTRVTGGSSIRGLFAPAWAACIALSGCGPSAADLASMDYTPVARDFIASFPVQPRETTAMADTVFPTPREVLERYIEAVGGRTRLGALNTRILRGREVDDRPYRGPSQRLHDIPLLSRARFASGSARPWRPATRGHTCVPLITYDSLWSVHQ